jgi:cellulose synthase/poly-beta-1,6-N-acetylglucosamine synthase-like glycosyltransferase
MAPNVLFYSRIHLPLEPGAAAPASPPSSTTWSAVTGRWSGVLAQSWTQFVTWIWWAACVLVLYTYLLYPVLLWVLTWWRREPVFADPRRWPRVSVVLAAYNEAAVIRDKIENTLALDYPKDLLELIIVSDGSTDDTDKIAGDYADRGIQLMRMAQNGGKTLAQNAGCRLAKGDILVFSDANSMYEPNALKELVRLFTDARVGCVCGELHYANPRQVAAAKGEGLYWRYERFLKRRESLLGSSLGANGSIYALRRELFVELDGDIISDFIMPLRIWRGGSRVVYGPAAVAVESAGNSFEDELGRRTRIIARSMHGLWTERAVLNPFRHGLFALQMISHKVLRWLVPVLLLTLLAASIALAAAPFYKAMLALQLVFYLLALLGYLLQQRVGRLAPLYLPAYFCAINLGAFLGLWNFLRGERYRIWKPVSRS